MTDEQMDARLRAAGERWRSANTTVAEPIEPSDVEITPTTRGHSRRRNWWAIASAAVVVAALVLGAILFARSGGTDDDNTATGVGQLTGVIWVGPDGKSTAVFTSKTVTVETRCLVTTLPIAIIGSRLNVDTRSIARTDRCVSPTRRSVTMLATTPLDRILRGIVSWSIEGHTLTLTTSGIGTIALATNGTPAPQLVGTRWRLVQVVDNSTDKATNVNQRMYLMIEPGGSFRTSDGCNTISGRARVGAATVTFAHLATTQVACPPLQDVLAGIIRPGQVSAQIGGTELILHTDVGTAIYEAVSTDTTALPTKLIGTWHLDTLGSGGANSGGGSTAMTDTRLTFDRTGELMIGRDCPGFRAAVRAIDHTLVISRVDAAAGPACPPNYSSEQQREDSTVNSVLMRQGTVGWSLSGDRVTLSRDNTQLTFTKTGGTPIPNIDILTGRVWNLSEIGSRPANSMLFGLEFGHDKMTTFCGATASMTLTPSQLADIGPWSAPEIPGCQDMGPAEKHVVFGRILTGSVSWRIDGDTLTITKIGVGKLTFVKSN